MVLRKLRDFLLDLPLFYKILIANTWIVAVGGALPYVLALRVPLAEQRAFIPVWVVILVIWSIVLNYLILKLALSPLNRLTGTAERISRGDLSARAGPTLFGDPSVERLATTLNAMLDRLEADRATIEATSRQLQALSARVLAAQEEERRRIARELHDDTGQALTALLIGLAGIASMGDAESMRAKASDLAKLADEALDGVRRLSLELRPSVLDDLGLEAAVRNLCREAESRFGLSVKLKLRGLSGRRLGSRVETTMYRVLQEALTNVARHSHSTRAEVEVEREADWLRAVVRDDGVGFDLRGLGRPRADGQGLGLFGMRERASLLGGTASIQSRPGQGTEVRVELPLLEADPATIAQVGQQSEPLVSLDAD